MKPVVVAARDEARAHGHSWVGTEHLLLALTKEPPGSPAREALRACGVEDDSVTAFVSSIAAESSERKGVSPNPRFYTVRGRAEGFAIRAGTPAPSSEDFLLALIWEDHGPHTSLLNKLGAGSAALQAALADQGLAVPAVAPPPFDNTIWGERVSILPSEYRAGLPNRIIPLLPKGIRFGCNTRGDEAWVIAEAGFDLEPYIEQARQAATSS